MTSGNKGAMLWGSISATQEEISNRYTSEYHNDGFHGNPRVESETRSKNTTVKLWKRIS